MTKYTVTIITTTRNTYEVEADGSPEAVSFAKAMFDQGLPGSDATKQMTAEIDPDDGLAFDDP